jgi:hypothetical protein
MTLNPHQSEPNNPLLPPPQPKDPANTRPPFNLTSMAVQVWVIQTWLAAERARKQEKVQAEQINL